MTILQDNEGIFNTHFSVQIIVSIHPLGSPNGGHTHASSAGSTCFNGSHTAQVPALRIILPSPLWKHILQSDTSFPP